VRPLKDTVVIPGIRAVDERVRRWIGSAEGVAIMHRTRFTVKSHVYDITEYIRRTWWVL
jgi:hypothetical protein